MNALDLINLGILINMAADHLSDLLDAISRQDETAVSDELRHIARSAGLVRTMAEAMRNSADKSTPKED